MFLTTQIHTNLCTLIIGTGSIFIIAYHKFDGFLLFAVLRVWDVLLFEGNRVMLFKTALALMELYGTKHSLCFILVSSLT